MSNKYNNSMHDAQPGDKQTPDTNEIGELRNGRLSQIKNSNPTGEGRENEYISELENSRSEE
ncbi:hypothetical protein [Paenibacillus sp. HJGM_3]|uniref:hypothetical protein n=1 Tax=Paenibacillus sp. HJGM_3 TaxID=3379816 RepID=UPI00385F3DD5